MNEDKRTPTTQNNRKADIFTLMLKELGLARYLNLNDLIHYQRVNREMFATLHDPYQHSMEFITQNRGMLEPEVTDNELMLLRNAWIELDEKLEPPRIAIKESKERWRNFFTNYNAENPLLNFFWHKIAKVDASVLAFTRGEEISNLDEEIYIKDFKHYCRVNQFEEFPIRAFIAGESLSSLSSYLSLSSLINDFMKEREQSLTDEILAFLPEGSEEQSEAELEEKSEEGSEEELNNKILKRISKIEKTLLRRFLRDNRNLPDYEWSVVNYTQFLELNTQYRIEPSDLVEQLKSIKALKTIKYLMGIRQLNSIIKCQDKYKEEVRKLDSTNDHTIQHSKYRSSLLGNLLTNDNSKLIPEQEWSIPSPNLLSRIIGGWKGFKAAISKCRPYSPEEVDIVYIIFLIFTAIAIGALIVGFYINPYVPVGIDIIINTIAGAMIALIAGLFLHFFNKCIYTLFKKYNDCRNVRHSPRVSRGEAIKYMLLSPLWSMWHSIKIGALIGRHVNQEKLKFNPYVITSLDKPLLTYASGLEKFRMHIGGFTIGEQALRYGLNRPTNESNSVQRERPDQKGLPPIIGLATSNAPLTQDVLTTPRLGPNDTKGQERLPSRIELTAFKKTSWAPNETPATGMPLSNQSSSSTGFISSSSSSSSPPIPSSGFSLSSHPYALLSNTSQNSLTQPLLDNQTTSIDQGLLDDVNNTVEYKPPKL